MRLLDRYLFRELLAPLAYSLGGFLIFWISYNLFTQLDELQAAKLHFWDVVELCVAWTPGFLVTALPIALLLALLYTLTHLARHNEITAMRATGISLWRISVPYFFMGFVASLALFALNEFSAPRSDDWATAILGRYIHKAPVAAQKEPRFQNDRSHRIWGFTRFDYRTGELFQPQVNWISPAGLGRELNAGRAVFTNGAWVFFDATEDAQAAPGGQFKPLLQTNALSVPEFTETPREIHIQMKINEYERLGIRKKLVPLADILDYFRILPDARAQWLRTELQQHLAAPWTCLVVVLIAIPFGAPSGRRNLFFGVAGSIFICFLYIVVQQVSIAMGSGGHWPGWLAAWLPNFVFGAAGLFLTARVR
ncbi:MAG: LptF/LptG family permease [Verrucomicrobia bacterium]|nr:LptF/LptG family permease [Verrucomicrobiota bacterium]